MQTNRLAAVLLAATLGLATVGCGSSDSEGATTTTAPAKTTTTADDTADGGGADSPEKAAFVKAADKICKESTDRINAETAELDSQEDLSDAEFEKFLKMAAEESIKQITAVRELGFPEADAEELDAAFTTFEEAFAKVADDPSKTIDFTSTPEFTDATTFMDDYGFQECGTGA